MPAPSLLHPLTCFSVSTRAFTSASTLRFYREYRNINRLSIDLPSFYWVNLRPRLTPIRLTLTGKPWSFGVRVSHPHYRYLCLHLLFQPLQLGSRLTFFAVAMLSYQYLYSTVSVVCFMPDYYPRRATRLVSCYALFK